MTHSEKSSVFLKHPAFLFPLLLVLAVFLPLMPSQASLTLASDLDWPAQKINQDITGNWSRQTGDEIFPKNLVIEKTASGEHVASFAHHGKKLQGQIKVVAWNGYQFVFFKKGKATEQAVFLYIPDGEQKFTLYALDNAALKDVLIDYSVVITPSSEYKSFFQISGKKENVVKSLASPKMIQKLLWSKRFAAYGR